jgi:hypothetical protein
MAKKCVHKGCGKTYEDENEECVYHAGPPVFHEGQKGRAANLRAIYCNWDADTICRLEML